jgi:hypothetical protein
LLGYSLELVNFYCAKARSLLVPTAALHGMFLNKRFNLPKKAVARVRELQGPELQQMSLMIYRIMETWGAASDVLVALEKLDVVNRKILEFSLAKMKEQYVTLRAEAGRLRAAGQRDEAVVIEGILETYRAIVKSDDVRLISSGDAIPALWRSLAASFGGLLRQLQMPSLAYAGWLDSLKHYADKAVSGLKTVVHDTVNMGLESFDNMSQVAANTWYGVEERGVLQLGKDFVGSFGDMMSRVGTGTLGQATMDKAQASFKAADAYIGKGFVAQAVANVATFGGYGLAKDLVTINDAKASAADKTMAAVGAILSFVPVHNVGQNLASGGGKGFLEGTKRAITSAGRVLKRGLKTLDARSALNAVSRNTQALRRFLASAGDSLSEGALKRITKAVFRGAKDTAAKLAALKNAQKSLGRSIKAGLASTWKAFKNAFKTGFRDGSDSARGALWKSLSDAYEKGSVKKLFAEMAGKVGTDGITSFMKGITTEVLKFYGKGISNEFVQDIIKKATKFAMTDGQDPDAVDPGTGLLWGKPMETRSSGWVHRTWKLADLGRSGQKEDPPVRRPVELTISHTDTGNGFGTMTWDGKVRLGIRTHLAMAPGSRYKMYGYKTTVSIRTPKGREAARGRSYIGIGYDGGFPGPSASLSLDPRKLGNIVGSYAVLASKDMNMGTDNGPNAKWHTKSIFTASVQVRDGRKPVKPAMPEQKGTATPKSAFYKAFQTFAEAWFDWKKAEFHYRLAYAQKRGKPEVQQLEARTEALKTKQKQALSVLARLDRQILQAYPNGVDWRRNFERYPKRDFSVAVAAIDDGFRWAFHGQTPHHQNEILQRYLGRSDRARALFEMIQEQRAKIMASFKGLR